MKITRTDPVQIQSPLPRKQEPIQTAPQSRQGSESQISATAQTMAHAKVELASTPDVDMAKVEQIRQAIGEGRLTLDLAALSQAILDLHRR